MTSQPSPLSDSRFLAQPSANSQYYKRYLETVCNNATLALFVMDEFQHCLYMNPAAEQLTGYALNEVQGRALHDIIHHTRPDGSPYPLCECPIDQAFPQNNREQGEEVFIHRDGHFYPVAYTASPICEGGQPIGTVIEVRDISQERLDARRRQEAADQERQLRQEAEAEKTRAELALQSITDVFVVFDQSWRYVYVNHAATQLLNLSESELLGNCIWDVFPDIVGTIFETEYRRAVEQQQTLEFEAFYPTWSRWFLNRVYPNKAGTAIVVTDITERKQTEAELREASSLLSSALSAGSIYTWRWKIQEDLIFTDVEFANLFGVSPEEAKRGLPIECFLNGMYPDDRDRIAATIKTAVETGDEYLAEYRVRSIDGSVRWVLARGRVEYDAAGNPVSFPGAISDITERKQTEAALQETEERLRLAIESTELGTWDFDFKTGRIVWNDGSKAMFGVPDNADIIYETVQAGMHPDDRDRVNQLVQAVQNGQNPGDQPIEYRIIGQADGIERWVSSRGKVFCDQSGARSRWVGTLLDITETKRHEAERQEALDRECQLRQEAEQAEAKLDAILQSITDAFAVHDREWRYTYVNQAVIDTLGMSESELIGRSFWDVFPDVVGTRLEAEYRRSVEEQRPVEFENYYEGWSRWYLNRLYPSATGVSIFFTDITERKHTEAALLETEERLRLAIEATQLGTWDMNLVTQHSEWDNSCKAMFGLPSDAVASYEVFLSALHPDDRDRVEQLVVAAIAPGGSGAYKAEYRAIGIADGIERWIDASGKALFDAAGKAIRLIGTVLDITETKRHEAERQELLEREQRLREQAEQANRIKDEFLAVLSHELRTPLNPILGWVKLLKGQKCPPPKIPQALETIERNAQLQAQLIEDLLDVSRILQGKIALNINSVNLADIVTAALATVQLAAEAKSISITLKLEFSGAVRGDENRLQQVLWNLLSNAVKFTPVAGRVEVTISQVGADAQIEICDTGKGIRADVLPYIFDRFRQADSSTTRQFGGLGLGLAIARHLIELHGGTIAAESSGEDQGAIFRVRLPISLAQSQANSVPNQRESGHNLAGIKILVVDDVQDNLDFVVFLLETAGAIVQATSSATLALEKLAEFSPDVLMSDIAMPDLDGYELLKRVRKQSQACAGASPLPKAIALTAYAGEVNHRQILAAGFQKHLSKPINPDDLINAIASLVKGLSDAEKS